MLFFNVNTPANFSGDLFGGTAPDGTTRNFIYKDKSTLGLAAIHSGLIPRSSNGMLKVTIVDPRDPMGNPVDFLGSSQTVAGGTITSDPAAYDDPFAYFVELYEAP